MTHVPPGSNLVVTGVTGFVGQSLTEHLANSGYQVIGISERPRPPDRIASLLSEFISFDLTEGWPDIGPFEGLIHLAGLATVGPSFTRPQEYIDKNSGMVTQLFENALKKKWSGRAIIVSSGAVYGSPDGEDNIAFRETSPTRASSPYVVSKLLVENQAEYYRYRGLDALVVRPFNHIGPGQDRGFIVPDLVARVSSPDYGLTLRAGNLDSARDYTDVRDIVRAYRLLLERPNLRYDLYNVCTGSAHSGWDVLEAVCSALKRSIPPTEIVEKRAIDPSILVGDANRLRLETGWEPVISLQTSINDFVNGAF